MTEAQVGQVMQIPQAFGDWYIVEPANPVDAQGAPIVLPDTAKDKWLCYGLIVSFPPLDDGRKVTGIGEVACWFHRSSAMEKIPLLDMSGVPIGPKYIGVHRSAIQAMWRVDSAERERFLSPPSTPQDHEYARMMKGRIEVQ